jgi:hypothetical protein
VPGESTHAASSPRPALWVPRMKAPAKVALPVAAGDFSWHGGTKKRPKLCTAWNAIAGAVCDKPRDHAGNHHAFAPFPNGSRIAVDWPHS